MQHGPSNEIKEIVSVNKGKSQFLDSNQEEEEESEEKEEGVDPMHLQTLRKFFTGSFLNGQSSCLGQNERDKKLIFL